MRKPHAFTVGIALTVLGLGFVFVMTARSDETLPVIDIAKLIAMETKNIDAELAKPSFLKKGQKRVRMAAFMIAVYAQIEKGDKAALRDQALKLMKAAETGKADEAKKLAATLSPNLKADASAKTAPVALEKQLDLETMMGMFNSDKVGGFGMEKALEDLVDAKGLDATQFEKTALLGQKVSVIGMMTQHYSPKKDLDAGAKKVWSGLASEMQKEASELAAAASMKKDADIGKIANKLTGTCTKCHDMFR